MNTYEKIAVKIVKEQELIIGPIAWREAQKALGSHVDLDHKEITVSDSDKQSIDKLVLQYERFFGEVSHQVCRDAARPLVAQLQPDQIPETLR